MSDNLYSPPTDVPDLGLPFAPDSFALTANGICCRGNVALPAICLQTGETDDLRVIHLSAESGTNMWKLRLASLVVGIAFFATSVVILFYLPTIASAIGVSTLFTATGLCCVTGLCIAGFAWQFFTQKIRINGFVSRRSFRGFHGGGALSLVTSLPMILALMFGRLLLWDQPARWRSLVMMATAIALGEILSRLLKHHWKSTRNRGLVLMSKKHEDGVFEVTGFTEEFLRALRAHEQSQVPPTR